MKYSYELIKSEDGLPVKSFIHSVDKFEMHWHGEIEIILVLQGTINIRVGNERFLLKENDNKKKKKQQITYNTKK